MSSRIDAEDVVTLRPAGESTGSGNGADISGGLVLRPCGARGETVELPKGRWDGGLLRVPLSGVPVPDGDYAVSCRSAADPHSTGPDAGDLRTSDPGFSLAARADYIARPRRRDLRVYRAPDGGLRLRARAARPYAEVGRVETVSGPGGTAALTVTGTLAFTARPAGRAPAVLEARQRGLDGLSVGDTEVVDGAFHCTLPLGPLADAHDPGRARNEWDLWLRVDGVDTELRLSAHADDIVGKKHRFSYPAVAVARPGRTLHARPYFTVDDDLSVLLRPATSGDAA